MCVFLLLVLRPIHFLLDFFGHVLCATLCREYKIKKIQAAIDGQSAAAYAEYLDLQNADRELDEQERISTERYLKR